MIQRYDLDESRGYPVPEIIPDDEGEYYLRSDCQAALAEKDIELTACKVVIDDLERDAKEADVEISRLQKEIKFLKTGNVKDAYFIVPIPKKGCRRVAVGFHISGALAAEAETVIVNDGCFVAYNYKLTAEEMRKVVESQDASAAMRDDWETVELKTWPCGCGHRNGPNLNTCAMCGRRPGGDR